MALTKARRGDVWLVDFGESVGREQGGRRPAVVVSADEMNLGPSGLVMVVPTTTATRGLVSHIELDPGETGLPEVSYAKCEDLKSISDERLLGRIGAVPPVPMVQIGRVIRVLLWI